MKPNCIYSFNRFKSTIEVTHLPETTYKTTKQVKPTIKSTQQIEATYISTSRPETSHKRSTLRETTVVSKSPETITNDSTNSLKGIYSYSIFYYLT